MRVLIASDTYHPHVNGASYFTQRLAHALANAGHEVAVVAPGPQLTATREMHGKVTFYGVRSFPIFIVPKFRFVMPILSGISGRVRAALREFKPDIVHIQMHFPVSRMALNEARKLNIPVVATNHFMPENLTHYLHMPKGVTDVINTLAWQDCVRIYEKTHGVSAQTHTGKAALTPWYKRSIQIISCGIDLARFSPNVDPTPARQEYHLPEKPILISVCRLDKEKKVDEVLRAVAKALQRADFHFVVAGHGAEEKKLKKLAKTLGIEEQVTFAGFVPDDLLPPLYAAAAVAINAGIAELQCIAAMEGMATGLPVLAARAVALPELVHDGENGYLFEPGNTAELAGRIVELMQDAGLRARMGQKSLEIISHHDINLTLENFEEFYRTALPA